MEKNTKTWILILYIFILSNINLCISQNLIQNPDFEIFEVCPTDMTISPTKQLIPYWSIPNRSTSDYFNSCATIQVNVPNNFMGNMFAYSGSAYIGIVLLDHPAKDSLSKEVNYREYIQTKLTKKLVKDQYYHIEIYYCIAPYSTFAVNRLGIYISDKKIRRNDSKVLKYKPQIEIYNEPKDKRGIWYSLQDTLCATGGELYLTIGNFYSDNNTEFKKFSNTEYSIPMSNRIDENQLAYYYIDFISVTPLD